MTAGDHRSGRSSGNPNFTRYLSKARYWGPAKVTIQALLTCIVVNCKRVVKLLEASCPPAGHIMPGGQVEEVRNAKREKLTKLCTLSGRKCSEELTQTQTTEKPQSANGLLQNPQRTLSLRRGNFDNSLGG